VKYTNGSIGPYKLVRKIGSGAFGTVWLAEKSTPIATMLVALKLPHTKNIDIEALKREAEIWIQASGHPNVHRLIDADIYAHQIVIVSEYMPDGSLSKWLDRHRGSPPSFKATSEMIDGVLAGLEHLHERQIIHRDLKPDNILLQGNAPLLSDFGISRLLPSSSHSLTIGGTPIYMAPEAFSYKRNAQTDIWSVGIIFYQLLVGRLPYYHSDVELLREAIAQHDPPPLPLSIPSNLRRVVEKALQRNPAHRYKCAAEMRHDLREACLRLQLPNPGLVTMPPTEASVLELASTLITPDISVPSVPAPSAPPPKTKAREFSFKPNVKEKCRAAFWIFLGQQPSLPFKIKLKNFVEQTFWESMGLACSLSVIFTLVFTFGGGTNVRQVVTAKLGMIAFYFLIEGITGYFNVRMYLDNPKEEPELIQISEWNDEWGFGIFWRARMRRWTTFGLLIEILCLTGKYFWDRSITW